MLGAFALLIVVQGALRKWLLPQFATPLYVVKDVALLGAFMLFASQQSPQLTAPLRRSMLPILWGGLSFVVLLQAFNFNIPSAFVGVLGIRSYLLYSLLLVLLPFALEQTPRPERLVTVLVVGVVAPVLVLGIYQYFQPIGSWINQYVADKANITGILSHPRITGTFSYIGGMGAFLLFAQFLAIGLICAGWRHRHRLYKYLGSGLLALALVAAPMNGSRSVVFGVLVPLPIVLLSLLSRQRGLSIVGGLLVVLVLGGYLATESEWAADGWNTITHRIENTSDQTSTRVERMILGPIEKVGVGGVLGYGAGATHQAAGALSASGRIQIEDIAYEGELGRVVLELGVIGALFYLALKGWLAWVAWTAMRRAETAWTLLLSVTGFCVLFLWLGSGMIVFNHIAGALYWLCAGSVVWVWSRQEVQQQARERVRTGG